MTGNTKGIGTKAVVALCATMAVSAWAQAPRGVKIKRISYAGTGCPAGSVAENLAIDGQALTLMFDSYVATVGPGVPITEQRKNCTISVQLDFPQGWTFSIVDVDYRGFASLQRNVQGEQKASYYFQGEGKTGHLSTKLVGPLERDYHIRDSLALTSLVWHPCGANRALNINSQVRVSNTLNTRGSGMLTIDTLDTAITHVYGIKWARC